MVAGAPGLPGFQLVYMACDVPTTLSTTLVIMPSVIAGEWHNAALVDSDSDESECEVEL